MPHSSALKTSKKKSSVGLWPKEADKAVVRANGRTLELTHLKKVFWPESRITKGDLLQYYAEVAPILLPHVKSRAMVMKRYPNGAAGEFFFMKRVPEPHPDWIQTCLIEHAKGNVIAFPLVQDLASLLWLVNLGCIDLNPWYGRCPDFDQPDYLHFDLDPTPEAGFDRVREVALIIHDALDRLQMPNYAKTTGSRGIHIYIPIVKGPKQKEVWAVAKTMAMQFVAKYPKLMTVEFRVDNRPAGTVNVDYNQNAWGRTLASVYSVRPKSKAPVSAPVSWQEVKKGIAIEDFRIDNMRARLQKVGDLWEPVDANKNRFNLGKFS